MAQSPAPEAAHKSLDWRDAFTTLPGPLVALIAIYAVHRLTKRREREKSVFELYKSATDAVAGVKTAALNAWSAAPGEERKAAIAETKWRLQQVGATVERVRMLSARRQATWGIPPWRTTSITVTSAMKELRDALTEDPFEDPDRGADKTKPEPIELAVGGFLDALDSQLFAWMT